MSERRADSKTLQIARGLLELAARRTREVAATIVPRETAIPSGMARHLRAFRAKTELRGWHRPCSYSSCTSQVAATQRGHRQWAGATPREGFPVNINVDQISEMLVQGIDRDGNGALDRKEIDDFLAKLDLALSGSSGAPPATNAPTQTSVPSMFTSLQGSENPSHDFKVLLNDTLVSAAQELGLSLTSIPGANYPAVAELRPDARGELTATQAQIRKELTSLVVEKLNQDPALPADMQIKVENPSAGSGADRIAFKTGDSDWLVFDVITGQGILKSRIAKNYLAQTLGGPVDRVHEAQLGLLSRVGSRLASLQLNQSDPYGLSGSNGRD